MRFLAPPCSLNRQRTRSEKAQKLGTPKIRDSWPFPILSRARKKGFSFYFSPRGPPSRTVPETQPLQVTFSLLERVDLRSQKEGILGKEVAWGRAGQKKKGKKDAQKKVGVREKLRAVLTKACALTRRLLCRSLPHPHPLLSLSLNFHKKAIPHHPPESDLNPSPRDTPPPGPQKELPLSFCPNLVHSGQRCFSKKAKHGKKTSPTLPSWSNLAILGPTWSRTPCPTVLLNNCQGDKNCLAAVSLSFLSFLFFWSLFLGCQWQGKPPKERGCYSYLPNP